MLACRQLHGCICNTSACVLLLLHAALAVVGTKQKTEISAGEHDHDDLCYQRRIERYI
jgi:hypothetical protein